MFQNVLSLIALPVKYVNGVKMISSLFFNLDLYTIEQSL